MDRGRSDIDVAGFCFRVSDQLGKGVCRERRTHGNDHRKANDAGDRRNVTDQIEIRIFIERSVDRVPRRHEKQRIAVRYGARDRLSGEIAARATAVLDDE